MRSFTNNEVLEDASHSSKWHFWTGVAQEPTELTVPTKTGTPASLSNTLPARHVDLPGSTVSLHRRAKSATADRRTTAASSAFLPRSRSPRAGPCPAAPASAPASLTAAVHTIFAPGRTTTRPGSRACSTRSTTVQGAWVRRPGLGRAPVRLGNLSSPRGTGAAIATLEDAPGHASQEPSNSGATTAKEQSARRGLVAFPAVGNHLHWVRQLLVAHAAPSPRPRRS